MTHDDEDRDAPDLPPNLDLGGAQPRFLPLTLGYMGLFVENSDPVPPLAARIRHGRPGSGDTSQTPVPSFSKGKFVASPPGQTPTAASP